MLKIIFFIFLLFEKIKAQKYCPNNGIPFDYQECRPEKRSECPAGFTCRKSIDNSTKSIVNLCCESGTMTISDWLKEKNLYPNIIGQMPFSTINSVQLSPINSNLNFPPIQIGDEIVVLSFPNYQTGLIQNVIMNQLISPGYYHIITIIDAESKPFAILLNYNLIVGQPTQSINVTSSQRFLAYLDNSTTIPHQNSYRSQYLVLIYFTSSPIEMLGNDPKEMLFGSCSDVKCLFLNSPISSKFMNPPTAATLFYLTTSGTIFGTDDSIRINGGKSINESRILSKILFLFFFVSISFV